MKSLRTAFFLISLAALLFFAGCTIKSNEGKDGKADKVDIKTPFGSLKVDEGVDVKDTGIPLYAGAKPYQKPNNEHNSANVNISSSFFGVKVVAAEFTSTDSPQKIADYYRNALKTYGKVVECKGSYSDNLNVQKDNNKDDDVPVDCADSHGDSDGVELKVGTRKHQHVVGIRPDGSGSRFALVYVNTRGPESGS
jgi:hypothetical protein